MKKIIFLTFIFIIGSSHCLAQNCEINVVPKPQSASCLNGEFKFSHKTKIIAPDETARRSAGILNDLLLKNYGFKLELAVKPPKQNAIVFTSKGFPVDKMPAEAYGLTVAPTNIQIIGNEIGQFYAVQTLLQLLPVKFKGEVKLPAIDISDEPRFKYRGMHLDVSRHFMPVEFVKKFIDLMAQYKFNQFHWHLTDDQGWRIEIKKYPRLTEIGSRRSESHEGRYSPVFKGDGVPVEGFYTQEQIREVVAYAKARRINVIPEIELPGHASAALAAYPQLGCKENYEYKVQQTWGIFKEVFCPTDATFKFLEDVLEETIALFPDSPYIHIGGDEVLKDHWKESAFVQELKRRENLKDEHEVQSYFIRRIEKFVNSKGRRIIGWDEILEGGLAPNATVMSWRGERGGIEAAKSKHDVIMTPTNYLYFDYGQGDPAYEPLNIGNHLPLETVYGYNPHPKELSEEEKKYILGAQANVWTEYLETPAAVEYMVFPRMLALAEVVWTPLEKKDFANFQKRLSEHFARLDRQNVNYRIPEPVGLKNVLIENKNDDIFTFELLGGLNKNWKIYYTLDGSEPTEKSELYKGAIVKPLGWGQKLEIKTIVVNEKGRKSVVYAATVLRREQLKAVPLESRTAGVNVKFYRGEFKSVKDLEAVQPTETAASKSIQLPQFSERTNKFKDPFGVSYEAFIYAPEDGIYDFQIEADDAATLEIGGETIIEAVGENGKLVTKNGVAPLQKGYHRVRLRYLQTGGEAALNLRWGAKGTGLRRIYGNELFY